MGDCLFETKRNINTPQETTAVSGCCKKTLIETISSLTEQFFNLCMERRKLRAVLHKMTTLVQQMDWNVRESISTLSMEVQITY